MRWKIPKEALVPIALVPLVAHLAACDTDPLEASSRERVTFALARDVAPPGLMEKVRAEFIDPSWIGDTSRMTVARVEAPNGQVLYLVDPSVVPPKGAIAKDPSLSPLCGTKGCRYLGFVERDGAYKNVLDIYAKDLLPPSQQLFETEAKGKGLPCLTVTELVQGTKGVAVTKTRYCYDGTEYRFEGFTRHVKPETK